MKNNNFDVIVIGAGHAGCEAALICARKNMRTLCLCINLDSVGFLACNPSIGGTAKGQLAAEVDALGGEMGKNADKCAISYKMLNESKGPAVHSLRAQVDKNKYHTELKKTMENTPNLFLKQGEVCKILASGQKIGGVEIGTGEQFFAGCVVVATGVYLNSKIIIGELQSEIGPSGFARASHLTKNLNSELKIKTQRFKTGTPARVHAQTINFDVLEVQEGQKLRYGFSCDEALKNPKTVPCHLTYTNKTTHDIIKNNIHLAPLYSGQINGIGARYCPSIEDKVVRFAHRERHQLFLEPEGEDTHEVYIQGLSTSMPAYIQEKIINSIEGLENAFVMRNAYAIEYDCIDAMELKPTLEHKKIDGLFFAGQINGTSGYEEAAAQGLLAGINAAAKIRGEEPLVVKRSEGYIGVLIDDLVTKGTNEPYRMMTSRAEYRLTLRQNNADLRMFDLAQKHGIVSQKRAKLHKKKMEDIKKCSELFSTRIKAAQANKFLLPEQAVKEGSIALSALVKRSGVTLENIKSLSLFDEFDDAVLLEAFISHKYEGYFAMEKNEIAAALAAENMTIPSSIDYKKIKGLKAEAAQKLAAVSPANLAQAGRISGVSPADISVLTVWLKIYKE